jgi:hypothetical protein
MDTSTLVMEQIDDGRRLLSRLTDEGIAVRAACWVKPTEEDRWTLYIATPLVEAKGPIGAYRDVYGVLRSLDEAHLTASDIKLVGEHTAVAQEMIDLLQHDLWRRLTRPRCAMLGGVSVDDLYVYPATLGHRTAASEKRRLKKDVEQITRPQDVMLTEEERAVRDQIVASGATRADAERWVIKNRRRQKPRPPIPAGTVVTARVAAHWGEKVEDDSDPLLMVEAQDGALGLVMKSETEPA